MTRETKEKVKAGWVVALPYVSAVILAIALCAFLYMSGKFSVEGCGLILLAVASLLGLKRAGNNDGAAAGGAALVIATSLLSTGCM